MLVGLAGKHLAGIEHYSVLGLVNGFATPQYDIIVKSKKGRNHGAGRSWAGRWPTRAPMGQLGRIRRNRWIETCRMTRSGIRGRHKRRHPGHIYEAGCDGKLGRANSPSIPIECWCTRSVYKYPLQRAGGRSERWTQSGPLGTSANTAIDVEILPWRRPQLETLETLSVVKQNKMIKK